MGVAPCPFTLGLRDPEFTAELRAYAWAGMRLLDEHGGEEAAEARRAGLVWLLDYPDSIDSLLGHRS